MTTNSLSLQSIFTQGARIDANLVGQKTLLRSKRVQLARDWHCTPTWPLFHFFRKTDMVAVTTCKNALPASFHKIIRNFSIVPARTSSYRWWRRMGRFDGNLYISLKCLPSPPPYPWGCGERGWGTVDGRRFRHWNQANNNDISV